MAPPSHRVVIVGGGFGGLFATRALRRAPVEVTLVDRDNHHLFQPLLYQVATGILSEGEIAPPIRSVLRRQRNARVELAEVATFDLDARELTAKRADGRSFSIPCIPAGGPREGPAGPSLPFTGLPFWPVLLGLLLSGLGLVLRSRTR